MSAEKKDIQKQIAESQTSYLVRKLERLEGEKIDWVVQREALLRERDDLAARLSREQALRTQLQTENQSLKEEIGCLREIVPSDPPEDISEEDLEEMHRKVDRGGGAVKDDLTPSRSTLPELHMDFYSTDLKVPKLKD